MRGDELHRKGQVMENITLGQIAGAIGIVTAIAVFFIAIFKWYKSHITDKFNEYDKELEELKRVVKSLQGEMKESKEERLILLKGQLACLKGLHNDLNCNGPVTQGIADLENYLIKKSHE